MLAFAIFAGACGFEHGSKVLVPTDPSARPTSYVGVWTSSSAASPSSNACGSFEWRVTQQTPTLIAGSFLAQCPGNLSVSGSAAGDLGGATIPIVATADATGPGVPTCEVSLKGVATLEGDTIRIPYTGRTCLGAVSGTEVLRKR